MIEKRELLAQAIEEQMILQGAIEEREYILNYINSLPTKEDLIKKYEKQANDYLNSIEDRVKRKEEFEKILVLQEQYKNLW